MRPGRPQVAFACFAIGALLVLLVDVAVARMFAGILLGVVAIATPEFLDGDRGDD